jgi:hypothetical protein
MRNTGSTGQFVTGIDSSGQLTRDTPPSISTPGVAYIETNGNDITGAVGNPQKPYLTAQEAFDDGARILHLGAGVTTSITVSNSGPQTLALFVTGCGLTDSNLSVSVTSTDNNVDLRVRSNQSVQFGSIDATADGDVYLEVYSLVASSVGITAGGTTSSIAKFCEIGADTSATLASSSYFSLIDGIAVIQP